MKVQSFDIPDLKLITPRRFEDARGFFVETWNAQAFQQAVAQVSFVQDNQSYSSKRGTLRGLHYQTPPRAQGKLVRVVRGSVVDVAVDVREGSPTFGRHVAVRLDAEQGAQLWVPAGFLHGFCTLEDHTEVIYKVTDSYSAENDAGVIWNDPDLRIEWQISEAEVILSDKDRQLPGLASIRGIFNYTG